MSDIKYEPVDNRDDFKSGLESIFNVFSNDSEFSNKALTALLFGDVVGIESCVYMISNANEKINGYLKQWDLAKDRSERESIVGNVKMYVE